MLRAGTVLVDLHVKKIALLFPYRILLFRGNSYHRFVLMDF